ncbi:MAG: NAD(+)/NADH kinase [Patescibacteria group bacterium]
MFTKKPINKVGIITKRDIPKDPKIAQFMKSLVEYLKKHKKEILLDNNACQLFKNTIGHKKEEMLKNADMVITLGGDGTILKTARRITRKKIPVLGVNMGNLGFLTECNPEEVLEYLEKIFAGQYDVDKRSLLRVTIYRNGKKIETFLALNDAVINQGAFARLITMNLEVNGRKLVEFSADGMIIATPTGSTAHSLSAGGPIIHPQIEGIIINPICPSSLAMRPIVVPDSRQLTVTIETQRREKGDYIGLTIDGQDVTRLEFGDKIKFRRSKRSIYLIRLKNRYYKMLRNKLNWGDK